MVTLTWTDNNERGHTAETRKELLLRVLGAYLSFADEETEQNVGEAEVLMNMLQN